MSYDDNDNEWPPAVGKEFIQSDEFGLIVLGWCEQLGKRYPTMDFSDAASYVFDWFDRKLKKNRRFINIRRFRSQQAFIAYIRQCVWNAARLADRQRQRHREILSLPVEQSFAANELSAESIASLEERVAQLPVPHKDILSMLFFEDYDIQAVARIFDKTSREIERLYEEAIDLLGDGVIGSPGLPFDDRSLWGKVEALTFPHKDVLFMIMYDGKSVRFVAEHLHVSEADVVRLYEEAIDMLGEDLL